MATRQGRSTNDAEIRQRIDGWTRAVHAKDADGVVSHYAPDIMSFDLAPPLRYQGADALRKSLAEWFLTFRGPVGYQLRDLSITAGDEVAFCHSLNHIRGARTTGEETDVWVRGTVGFRRIGGQWMITHEHLSVPFEMEPPFKASLDLKP
jgi:ketosteroid isomerase-like protein